MKVVLSADGKTADVIVEPGDEIAPGVFFADGDPQEFRGVPVRYEDGAAIYDLGDWALRGTEYTAGSH